MTTLMIQGTTSDAGKSTVVAGLCRVLKRRGLSVAPFKPQNMALNSAVTSDGGEIGRSTALQAQAAGVLPHSDMNPVLLKPETDRGAQVILRGKVHGHMDALDYHAYKRTAKESVMAAWQALESRYDVIIAEGAGSPAEINLRGDSKSLPNFFGAMTSLKRFPRGSIVAHFSSETAKACFTMGPNRGSQSTTPYSRLSTATG